MLIHLKKRPEKPIGLGASGSCSFCTPVEGAGKMKEEIVTVDCSTFVKVVGAGEAEELSVDKAAMSAAAASSVMGFPEKGKGVGRSGGLSSDG